MSVYQSKSSFLSIQGYNDARKEVTLGTANFDLAKYVGKINLTDEHPLSGGLFVDGKIKIGISVVTIPKANLVGVDPMSLLNGVSP